MSDPAAVRSYQKEERLKHNKIKVKKEKIFTFECLKREKNPLNICKMLFIQGW